MQQRQLRLGDILDDYCPRERRVTNHAVVAMIGEEVKQTRCTTCEAEHEYKHAKVPRQRRKSEAPAALYAQVAAGAPKRVTAGEPVKEVKEKDADEPRLGSEPREHEAPSDAESAGSSPSSVQPQDADFQEADSEDADSRDADSQDEGPVHRPLIRASLPRPEGQQPPARPIPEFTIRQPGAGRPHRFRPRHRGGQGHPQGQGQQGHHFQGGNRSGGNPMRGPRPHGTRPGLKRHGPGGGRKRSK